MPLNAADVDRVRSLPLFNKVSDPALTRLANWASIRPIPARTALFNEGKPALALYVLFAGSVELFSEPNERRSTIAIISSSKPFVLTSVVENINPVAARTLERSELLVLPLKVVHELMDREASFANAITHALAKQLRELIEDRKNDRLKTTIERLADWMLRTDERAGGTGHFVMPYGKRTLASHLGMAPENLSRNLASLAQLGVAVRGRHVSLGDRAALVQFARREGGQASPAAKKPAASISTRRIRDQPTLAPTQVPDSLTHVLEP